MIPKCICCSTSIYKIRAKKLCSVCYGIDKKVNDLERVDVHELELLRVRYFAPKENHQLKLKPIDFQKARIADAIKAKSKNLILYGDIDEDRKVVDILLLERIMNEVARRCKKGNRFYENDLMYFQTRFSAEQRKIIALKLLKLVV